MAAKKVEYLAAVMAVLTVVYLAELWAGRWGSSTVSKLAAKTALCLVAQTE